MLSRAECSRKLAGARERRKVALRQPGQRAGSFRTACAGARLERRRAAEEMPAMDLIDLLILLLVAGVCGALGQAIGGYSRGGCLVSIALGFIGAIIGMWIARSAKLP